MSSYESLRAAGTSVVCLSPVSNHSTAFIPLYLSTSAFNMVGSGEIRRLCFCRASAFVILQCTPSLSLPFVHFIYHVSYLEPDFARAEWQQLPRQLWVPYLRPW